MRIAYTGNVGIGTDDPAYRLDVVGAIRLTGQLISTVAGGTAPLVVASNGLVTNLNADLLDGQHASAFASSSHTHQTLTAGTGLSGGSYNGGSPATFAVIYGTSAGSVVQGNQTASIAAGSGLTGGVAGDLLGDGFAATLNVGGGNGIAVGADSVDLGLLTANWNQTGPFDIVLNNASSELQILESAGGAYYGTFDVGDLGANQTYNFSSGGTVWTSGNDGTGSTLDADLLDGSHATDFALSTHSHDHGTLTGLGDDDHPQYLNLSQSETVNGNTSFAGTSTFNGGATFNSIPAFNGGTTGSTAPFTVDSTFLVTNLNADLLDGQHGSYYQNASNINAGTLGYGYYSAYGDLGNEGYLDNNAATDLLTQSQGDTRYVNEGQAGSISSAMIQDGATLAEILDDDGAGSTLDADLLDGSHAAAFALSGHNHWGATWTGSGTGLTLSGGTIGLSGSGSTYGVYGTTSSTSGWGVFGEATATSGPTVGVEGRNLSSEGYGGWFVSDAETSTAVKAGAYGRDDSDTGFGVAGHNYWSGVGVGAWSYSGDIMRGYAGDYPSTTNLRFYLTNAGNMYVDGTYNTFKATGDDEHRTLYGMTSAEAWAEDFGSAALKDGKATVTIDPVFAQTVNLAVEYHVYLTPLCQEAVLLFVTAKGPASFTVQGVTLDGKPSACSFDYRIVVKQRGYENQRLEEVEIPAPVVVDKEKEP